MRLVHTKSCIDGVFLGKSIYDEKGRPLVIEGTKLTNSLINSLLRHGINMVYIKDSRTDDIDIDDVIPVDMRVKATEKIKNTFDDISKDNSKIDKVLSNNIDSFKDIIKGIYGELNGNKKSLNLISTVKAYDSHLFTHSFNVMVYCTQIALHMGYSKKQVEELGVGALLHDIGKLMIPIEILNKEGKLNDEEFNLIKDHSELGFNILRKQHEISLLSAHCAYQHHERIDGSGYPRGLKGNEIHPYAKIMGVADVFDAVTSDRVYRKAMLPHEGMELIFAGAGTQFDMDVVQAFTKSISLYPEGTGVVLKDGSSGVVIKYNKNLPARPVIRILKDNNGNQLKNTYDIDLSKNLNIMIVESDLIL